MNSYHYKGNELDLFANVVNWKEYWRSFILPYIQGDVLEVGCGIGSNTVLLRCLEFQHWVCLEPDERLLMRAKASFPACGRHEFVHGTLDNLDCDRLFDTILYLDVLEHIREDRVEVAKAASRLKPNGTLIILAPAHQWLFLPFDAAVGHCRRYTKTSLQRLAPAGLSVDLMIYLDSCGMAASLANRFLKKASFPSETDLQFWDRCLVPSSKWLDRTLRFSVGKSILCVWQLRSVQAHAPGHI